MKSTLIAFALLFAAGTLAAEPKFIDELMETPLTELRAHFPDLRTEGCYRIGEQRFVLVSIEKKDQKPWRVLLSSVEPCRRPTVVTELDLQSRSGVQLGDDTLSAVERMGRPDGTSTPDPGPLRRIGETEYFYICRIEEACARHTSLFVRGGIVTGIAEWYSE